MKHDGIRNGSWPVTHSPDVHAFLQRFKAWADTQPALLAAALVGSHARGQAKPDSDIDLVLLFQDPQPYLTDPSWLSSLGNLLQYQQEAYGKVTSLRVWYADGLEVEFGLADSSWGSDPGDKGDARVIRDGIIVLFEKNCFLSDRLAQVASFSREEQ